LRGDRVAANSSDRGEPGSRHGRDLALLVGMNLIWGLNLIVSKIGVGEFTPIFFTAMRFGSLALFLLPTLRIHRGQMKNLLAAALLTGPLSFGLLFTGISLAQDASTVAIATQLGVPFSTLLSVWLLGERIHWRRVLGIGLAFSGVLIIGLDPRVFAYRDGLGLVVASSFVAALGLIFVKRLSGVRPLELQAWIASSGGVVLMLMSLLLESGQGQSLHTATWRGWAALAFTAVMSSLIAHSAWYYLISRYPVTRLSPITLLSPLFGVLFGVTLLGDQLTARMLAGGAVTLAGVFIVVLRERQIVDTGT
jgi:O-acetylserine/cysteine efflux transporter